MRTYPQSGLATVALGIGAAVVVLAAAGAYFFLTAPPADAPAMPVSVTSPTAHPSPARPSTLPAGASAPLLDFNAADFAAAQASNKLIVLYFYANWCPICRAEFPKMEAAFNQLQSDHVVGFRVNFNDNETDAAEVALARQHGVAYQHTKVFIKNNQRILKSPEAWETARYLTEIETSLNAP